ncbi:MAG: inner membrane CreD family protein [Candidatus Tritonobacter lacicola]|nr:inner membrane CreD family protein [Candidatus Tritonobacter lacicola]
MTMGKSLLAIIFIFICSTVAWVVLGTTVVVRTHEQDTKLKRAVGRLWGNAQRQKAPTVSYDAKNKGEDPGRHFLPLDKSDITVGLDLEHRKKGLLWYSTYRVAFSGKYRVLNSTKRRRDIIFKYSFPAKDGIYDNFMLVIDGEGIEDYEVREGVIVKKLKLGRGEAADIEISYVSRGLDEWWYVFGPEVSRVKDFALTINTDFEKIDFPEKSISPTSKEETKGGWELTWEYTNLLSGVQIGLEMPRKLNPGPFVSRVSFFAPVSLFLFFFLLFIITAVKRIDIHPMNYFFLAGAFFSFHLLMAYLVDHVSIHRAFAISSVVSIFLVISYMRLVVGPGFAFFTTGISQFVYLVLFSYAFFLEGFTGLSITVCCIVTLFIVMQLTGRVNWGEKFRS